MLPSPRNTSPCKSAAVDSAWRNVSRGTTMATVPEALVWVTFGRLKIQNLHVAWAQDDLAIVGGADEAAGCVELNQIVIQPVGRRPASLAQEALSVELDLADEQTAEVIGADPGHETAFRPALGQGCAASKMTETLCCQASNWSRGRRCSVVKRLKGSF